VMLSPVFFSWTPLSSLSQHMLIMTLTKESILQLYQTTSCTSISHALHLSLLSALPCGGKCEVRTGKSSVSSSGSWTLNHRGWRQSFSNSAPFSDLLHCDCAIIQHIMWQ
jgi:hypothetical protein